LHQQLLKLTSIRTAAFRKSCTRPRCIAGNAVKTERLHWSAALTRADAALARSFLHCQGYSPQKLCNWQARLCITGTLPRERWGSWGYQDS